jgi:hypothetical protein
MPGCLRHAPGLRSRSYFGRVGPAGRPAAFSSIGPSASRQCHEGLRRPSAQVGRSLAVLSTEDLPSKPSVEGYFGALSYIWYGFR